MKNEKKNPISRSYQDERGLLERVFMAQRQFRSVFETSLPEVIARAPGRAEIIGNHTDYNNGFALAAGISRSTLTLAKKRDDDNIHIFSNGHSTTPVTFSLKNDMKPVDGDWLNYVKAVIQELINRNVNIRGTNILIDSNVPSSGGVSSSAALELSIVTALTKLYGVKMSPLENALLCKQAENGPLVQAPCGFLDQGTSSLSRSKKLTFLDFEPDGDIPVSDIRYIPAHLHKYNLSFVITVNRSVKRNLGQTGYPARREMCEKSLPILAKLLDKNVKSLRDISVEEFERVRTQLDKHNTTMRKRVEHVVYENNRVLDSVHALENDDMEKFGNILTASGRSALDLYDLDEKTPELTFLVEKGRTLDGVLGLRNMGGGFSAITLALVENSLISSFKSEMADAYKKEFPGYLEFIQFSITQGAETLINPIKLVMLA